MHNHSIMCCYSFTASYFCAVVLKFCWLMPWWIVFAKLTNQEAFLQSRDEISFYFAFGLGLPPRSSTEVKTLPMMKQMQEMCIWSLGREDPLEEEMTTSPFFLLGKFHGYRSIQWAIVHGIAKCQTWLRDWANTPCDFIVCDSLAAAKLASWGIVPISGTLHDLLLHR